MYRTRLCEEPITKRWLSWSLGKPTQLIDRGMEDSQRMTIRLLGGISAALGFELNITVVPREK